MPNPSKGARLYLRAAAGKRKAVWLIRDAGRDVSTGCPAGEREAAERKLADYIRDKHKPSRAGHQAADQIPVADVLALYLAHKKEKVPRQDELKRRIKELGTFFGAAPLSVVTGPKCRAYAKHRGTDGAARRELEDLRAAINWHAAEGLCRERIVVTLPPKGQPRERWLTRSEAARLLWATWKGGQGKRKHIARFILVGLYTGTRATAICQAAMKPTPGRGHVDLKQGVFYRRGAGERETNKRRPPMRLHPKLLAHLRRWHAKGKSVEAVVEWHGAPIERMSKGFRHAAREVGLAGVSPHTLRHTSITWAMQNGADLWDAAGNYGVTRDILERVYGHHHPDHGASVHAALSRKRS